MATRTTSVPHREPGTILRGPSPGVQRGAHALWLALLLPLTHLAAAAHPVETDPDDLVEQPGLADYIAYAELHNPELNAAYNEWQAALARVSQERSLPDPRLNYGYFLSPVETRVGPQRQRIGIAQPVPWFGKRGLQGDAAARDADAQFQTHATLRLALARRIKRAYYEYYYLAQALAITREHIELVGHLESVARAQLRTGSAAYNAPVQAQVELGKLDDRLRTLESLRVPIVAGLNADLNRPPDAPLPWPAELPDAGPEFTADEVAAWMREANPELLRLRNLEDREEVGVRLAEKNAYPDIIVGIEYIDTGDARMPNVEGSGDDAVIAMASINLPIGFGRIREARREASLRRDAVRDRRADVANRLEASLRMVLYKFRDAERKLDLYGNTLIPKARQSVNVAQQAFEAGNQAFISLIDAERMLLEFQLARERARADRLIHLAEIEAMVNRDLCGTGSPGSNEQLSKDANARGTGDGQGDRTS